MYGMDLYRRVRLACHGEGLSQRDVARRFGVDRQTVAKMLLFPVPPGYWRRGPPPRPKLDAFVGIIQGDPGRGQDRASQAAAHGETDQAWADIVADAARLNEPWQRARSLASLAASAVRMSEPAP